MRMKLTTWILLAAVIGFATGTFTHDALSDTAAATTAAGYYGVFPDFLLRLVKRVIVSLLALGMGMLLADFFFNPVPHAPVGQGVCQPCRTAPFLQSYA